MTLKCDTGLMAQMHEAHATVVWGPVDAAQQVTVK